MQGRGQRPLLLLRFPELQELLLRTAQKSALWLDSNADERSRLSTELLMLEGRVESVIKFVESDYAEAAAPGPESLRQALARRDCRHKSAQQSGSVFQRVLQQMNLEQYATDFQKPSVT